MELDSTLYPLEIFIYGFLMAIGSMNMSISAKIQQYGSMRAIGMSIKQLERVITAESVIYAILAVIILLIFVSMFLSIRGPIKKIQKMDIVTTIDEQ